MSSQFQILDSTNPSTAAALKQGQMDKSANELTTSMAVEEIPNAKDDDP